jgi:hypothetical protein
MEQFIKDHPAFVYLIFVSLVALLGYLAKWLIRNAIKDVENHKLELVKVKADQKEIVENYITRFDRVDGEFKKVREQANDHKLEIVGTLSEMKLDMQSISDAVTLQTKICNMVQEQKKQ